MSSAGAEHAGSKLPAAFGVEQQHVGFQRLEAALARLARGGLEVVEAAHRRLIDHLAVEKLGTAGAQDAATRPIDRQALTHGAAKKLVDGNAERLAADIEAGILDGGDGVGRKPARGRARAGIERGVDAGDRARVLADEFASQPVDQGGHSLAAALVELGPAGDALVGGDLQEGIGVPAAIGMEVLELDDLHSRPRLAFARWRR
jgi:hypothetical protein